MDLMGTIEGTFSQVNSTVFRQVNRATDWWNLPTARRRCSTCAPTATTCASTNLYDTERRRRRATAAARSRSCRKYRTYDGSLPGPDRPARWAWSAAASAATRPPTRPRPSRCRELMEPSPREVANRLLLPRRVQAGDQPQRARRLLDPVREPRLVRPRRERPGHLHRRAARRGRRVARRHADEGAARPAPTAPGPGRAGLPPTYVNTVTHWWDGSQIYGSTEERNRELRAGEDGKMTIEDGHAPERDRPEARRRRPDRLLATTTGSASRSCTRCSSRSTTRSATTSRAPTRPGTTSGCSSPRGSSTRR